MADCCDARDEDLRRYGGCLQAQHVETEALQRSLTVFEILGNLHCHGAQVEVPQMAGHFARLLHAEVIKRDKAGDIPRYVVSGLYSTCTMCSSQHLRAQNPGEGGLLMRHQR